MSLIQEALERAGRLPNYKSEILTTSRSTAAASKRKKIPALSNLALNKAVLRNTFLFMGVLFSIGGIAYFSIFFPKMIPQKVIPKAIWGGSFSLVSSNSLQKPEFKLTGITYSRQNEPLALINNQVVAVGERLKEDAVVKEIHRRDVTLEFRGSTITLSL